MLGGNFEFFLGPLFWSWGAVTPLEERKRQNKKTRGSKLTKPEMKSNPKLKKKIRTV